MERFGVGRGRAGRERLGPWVLLFLAGCATAPRVGPTLPRPTDDPRCGPFGCPARQLLLASHWVVHDGYLLEHSDQRKVALWVAHRLTRADVEAEVEGGRPKWKAEPSLPKEARAEDSDYRSATDVYDRGHLAPNADFGSKALRNQTFYLANAVPQVKANNQGLWRALEAKVRAWVVARGEAFVVTGAIVGAAAKTIGEGRVAVPERLYKIVLAPGADGAWEAIALVAENRAYPSPYDFSLLIESIDQVESETGLDFFPELLPDQERRLESAPAPLW